MKLPILIRATLMPASLAPSRFPPVAIGVQAPAGPGQHDVEDMTITTAQMISAQVKPPNHRPRPAAVPAGWLFSWAAEVVSVKPGDDEGGAERGDEGRQPQQTVSNPLISPMRTPQTSAATMARSSGKW